MVDECLSFSKAAFDLNYVNSKLQVTRQLLNHIEYCLRRYRVDNDIYAPYFVFCQSSGYGISRLITQLAVGAFMAVLLLTLEG